MPEADSIPTMIGGMPAEREVNEFKVIVTRSAGSDGAIVVFIDGSFGVDGNAPLRILVNEGVVYAEAGYRAWESLDGESWMREAMSVGVDVAPEDIAFTGFLQ